MTKTSGHNSSEPRESRPPRGPRTHVLTVSLEDYFQVGVLRKLIRPEHWDRFELRLVDSTRQALALLAQFDARATFFVSGWVAERCPELVAEVGRAGHELAASGYLHRPIREFDRESFRADVRRSRTAVERAGGVEVRGFRVADQWLGPGDRWALDELAALGFHYDASLAPWLGDHRHQPERRFWHQHHAADGQTLWELPPATWQLAGRPWPISGGNYFRQLPHTLLKHGVAQWDAQYPHPLVLYFHVWELDPEQPRVSGLGWLSRLRHYRNLNKMRWVLEDYLGRYRFDTAARALDLPAPAPAQGGDDSSESVAWAPRPVVAAMARPTSMMAGDSDSEAVWPAAPTGVTVVVPCYNEGQTLGYLANTLRSLGRDLAGKYDLRFVLVDDGSQDETWDTMNRVFGAWPQVALARHARNRGIAAAIETGWHRAETEIVCSIDSDCSYDPRELARMIPRLTPGVDLVTASPYHPQGQVLNVPGWRLVLSRGASALYRGVLHHRLATYTSCFRVYRRSTVAQVTLEEGGFLGIAELVARLDHRPGAVVEHPATLEVRLFGQSKMRVARTVGGHLKFLARLAWRRWVRRTPPARILDSFPESAGDLDREPSLAGVASWPESP